MLDLEIEELIEEYPFLQDLNREKLFILNEQLELFLHQSKIWLVDFKKNFSDLTLIIDEIKHFTNKEINTHSLLIKYNDAYNDFTLALKENDRSRIFHYLPIAINYIEDTIFVLDNYLEEKGYK